MTVLHCTMHGHTLLCATTNESAGMYWYFAVMLSVTVGLIAGLLTYIVLSTRRLLSRRKESR